MSGLRRIRLYRLAWGLALLGLAIFLAGCTGEAQTSLPGESLTIGIDLGQDGQGAAGNLQLLALLTVLTLAPAILIMMTSFTRIVIVLAFIRSAISIPQLPPNQLLVGLALFLTFFVMAPVWNVINQEALTPYLAGEIDQETAISRALEPVRGFMLRQTREKDLALFVHLAGAERPRTPRDVPTYILLPAFVISELKTAFQMGVVIFVPFLVIDLVVSSVLMSMGMMMLPPAMISLPFKVLLFVMVDGWHLIVGSLVASFAA